MTLAVCVGTSPAAPPLKTCPERSRRIRGGRPARRTNSLAGEPARLPSLKLWRKQAKAWLACRSLSPAGVIRRAGTASRQAGELWIDIFTTVQLQNRSDAVLGLMQSVLSRQAQHDVHENNPPFIPPYFKGGYWKTGHQSRKSSVLVSPGSLLLQNSIILVRIDLHWPARGKLQPDI